jgi:hypothetical protein
VALSQWPARSSRCDDPVLGRTAAAALLRRAAELGLLGGETPASRVRGVRRARVQGFRRA